MADETRKEKRDRGDQKEMEKFMRVAQAGERDGGGSEMTLTRGR